MSNENIVYELLQNASTAEKVLDSIKVNNFWIKEYMTDNAVINGDNAEYYSSNPAAGVKYKTKITKDMLRIATGDPSKAEMIAALQANNLKKKLDMEIMDECVKVVCKKENFADDAYLEMEEEDFKDPGKFLKQIFIFGEAMKHPTDKYNKGFKKKGSSDYERTIYASGSLKNQVIILNTEKKTDLRIEGSKTYNYSLVDLEGEFKEVYDAILPDAHENDPLTSKVSLPGFVVGGPVSFANMAAIVCKKGKTSSKKNLLIDFVSISDKKKTMTKSQAEDFAQVKDWISVGLECGDAKFANWMVKVKSKSETKFKEYLDPTWCLNNLGKSNHKNLEELKTEAGKKELITHGKVAAVYYGTKFLIANINNVESNFEGEITKLELTFLGDDKIRDFSNKQERVVIFRNNVLQKGDFANLVNETKKMDMYLELIRHSLEMTKDTLTVKTKGKLSTKAEQSIVAGLAKGKVVNIYYEDKRTKQPIRHIDSADKFSRTNNPEVYSNLASYWAWEKERGKERVVGIREFMEKFPEEAELEKFKKTQNAEQKSANQAYFKQLIKAELAKLLKNQPQGVDKAQIIPLLEENLKNTANLNKLFDPLKKEVENKLAEASNQIKTKLQTVDTKLAEVDTNIEQKLGGPEKFRDGVYKSEEEIIAVSLKALENKGPLLRKLRNIIGEKEFNPEEPGEGVPPGREGMRVDPEAIALQQAEQKARIDAIESPNGLIGDDKKIETYTTETVVKGQSYKKSIQKIDPLKHLAPEVKKAHDFIVKRIDLETVLDNFPKDEEIGKEIYDEKTVPDTINYEELRGLRDKKIKELFKQYFQGQNPTKLDDKAIEFPAEIKEAKTTYQGIADIEVLKVKKQDIDNEIVKVNNLVKQINSYQFLRDLDKEQVNIDKQFEELQRNLLPPKKDEEIKTAVEKQRQNL
nr:11302_t:CDS:10 [Entrophospora candida]